MMTIRKWQALMLMAGAVALGTAGAWAADIREAGRQAAQQLNDAIMTVRIVSTLKVSAGGQDREPQEIKSETSGTVISAEGLTIVPLMMLDRSQMIKRMWGGENEGVSIDSQVKDIKFLRGAQEVAATVVLRDNDLDLAFLRPLEKPTEPYKFIDLANGVAPQLLEPVFVLTRMGRIADRQIALMSGEIQSIVNKPRTFYVPSAELSSGGLGVPIFNAELKLVGIILMRGIPGGDESSFGGNQNMMPIVLPAADVAEVAAQAPEKAPRIRESSDDEAGEGKPDQSEAEASAKEEKKEGEAAAESAPSDDQSAVGEKPAGEKNEAEEKPAGDQPAGDQPASE